MMQCSSCGAQNKDAAKFCAECGKPLLSGNDEEQIERLVEYIVFYEFDDEAPPDANAKQRLREAARVVHAKWKASPNLEDVTLKVEADDINDDFDGEELAEIFSGREAAERAEEKRKEEEDNAREEAEERERERKEEEKRAEKAKEETAAVWRGGAIVAMIIGAAVAIGLWEKKSKHKEHDEEPTDKHEQHRGARTTTATAITTAATVAEPPQPVEIASCTCVSRANGKNTFVLEQPPAGGPWHMKWKQVSGFTSMNSGFWLGESDAAAATSIPRNTTQLHAAMACENEIVAVVAGEVASAWTGTDNGELLWTRKLPAPYAFPSDAGLGLEDVLCAPALGVTGNVFTVPLAKGKSVTLSIRDGSVVK